ncbi:hypothetical protein FDUTEX481_04163 [Tolypothrix sp. PCC 7601]|nr:hypothetical protein FDUTEX481_04163 [Tolypothrix sp. PCC 7601]
MIAPESQKTTQNKGNRSRKVELRLTNNWILGFESIFLKIGFNSYNSRLLPII